MILSDKTIKEYLKLGQIKIFPEFKLADVRPAGIRLHLGAELLIPIDGQTVDLDSNEDVEFEHVNISQSGFGEVCYQEGSTVSGIKAVTDFLRSQDIDLGGFHMADGSGLSRKNLVTTKQLVEILLKMKNSAFFPIFFNSLPQEENLGRAKPGSMSLIKGYAGYKGKIAFAILINNYQNERIINEKIRSFLDVKKPMARSAM